MKKKNYIEIEVAVGYDKNYSEKTDIGEFKGKEIYEVVLLPVDEARRIIQESVRDLDYKQAARFAQRYEK